MVLKCKKCGNKVSSKDEVCSKCGEKIEPKKKKTKLIVIVILLIIAVVVAVIGVVCLVKDKNDSNDNEMEESNITKKEQYITEAITVLEDYRDNKEAIEETVRKLENISSEVKAEAEKIKEKEEKRTGKTTIKSLEWSTVDMSIRFVYDTININYIMKIKPEDSEINKCIKDLKELLDE